MADKEKKQDEIAEISKEDLAKVKDFNLLNTDQLNFLFKKTPKEHIYERPAKGGGKWKYVTGTRIKKVLNLMFGWDWDFIVDKFDIKIEVKQVIVLGRLAVRTAGHEIIKMQFGRADIKFKTETRKDDKGNVIMEKDNYGKMKPKRFPTTQPLDLGNDLKAATTDALKKCASELGIASDVYAPNEFKAIHIMSEDEEKAAVFGEKHKTEMATISNIDELDMYYELHPELVNDENYINHFKKLHDELSGINQEVKE